VGADGSYTITGIDPDTYTVRVTFIGYRRIEQEVALEPGETVTRDFTMERAPLQGEGVTVTVGARGREVAAEDMAAPVDVYSAEEIQVAGAFGTGQILKEIAPSVNFPQNTLSDGMDALRSFTLRDGASSQYGSDAIAGVVNIQLKEEPLAPTIETRLGGYITGPYPNDGTTYSVRPSLGVGLGEDGFLNFFGEYRLRTPTNRAGPANYNLGPRGQGGDTIADPDGDGLFEIVDKNNSVEQPAFHWGDGESESVLLWLNGAYPVARLDAERPTELYAFGGYSYRKGKGQGFYREGTDSGN
jgi:iron complex outermembrane receptor protein